MYVLLNMIPDFLSQKFYNRLWIAILRSLTTNGQNPVFIRCWLYCPSTRKMICKNMSKIFRYDQNCPAGYNSSSHLHQKQEILNRSVLVRELIIAQNPFDFFYLRSNQSIYSFMDVFPFMKKIVSYILRYN